MVSRTGLNCLTTGEGAVYVNENSNAAATPQCLRGAVLSEGEFQI